MNVQIATICDAAVDHQGKLGILGTFDTIFTKKLPAIHPQCSIALRLLFRKIEEGSHKLRITIIDEDGKPVIPGIEVPADIKIPEGHIFATRNFVLNIQQIKFEKAGAYSVDIAIDGRQEANIPLYVKLIPAVA